MRTIPEQVQTFIEQNHLPVLHRHWLLAVSGGADSMVLLDILWKLKARFQLTLTVAHIHHGLRPEADAELEFVQQQAQLRQLPCRVRRVHIPQIRQPGQSLEDCAREVRYQCLEDIRRAVGADSIAVAHHKDDAAETVLLHLLRGSGLTGLQGIQPRRENIVRPLLGISRRDILTYAQETDIPYCTDASNADNTYTRNRIRNTLLPFLKEQFNPNIVNGLLRLADLAREDETALVQWTEQTWETVCTEETPETIVLSVSALAALPRGLQRRLVRKALSRLKGSSGWSAEDTDAILRLRQKTGSQTELQLKKNVYVRKQYEKLLFTCKKTEGASAFCQEIHPLETSQQTVGGRTYTFQLFPAASLPENQPGLKLDADRLPKKLFLRSRKPGDRFSPAGAKGGKKLKDWMIDHKIPVCERDTIALLSDEQDIVYAVLPRSASAFAAVTSETRRILLCTRIE